MAKYLNETGLAYFFEKLKQIFVRQEAGKSLTSNDFTDADKTKLNGVEAGAQANQDAFSTVMVGQTELAAGTTTDAFSIAGGTNVQVTADPATKTVTIGAPGINYDPFTGATVVDDGTEGLVPAPQARQAGFVLLGNGKFNKIELERGDEITLGSDESKPVLMVSSTDGTQVASMYIGELFQQGHYGTSTTEGSESAKAVRCDSFTLTTGGFIFVKFSDENTAALADLTLNINGTGAYPITRNGSTLTEQLKTGIYYLFLYNGSTYDLVATSDEQSGGGGGQTYETMTQAEADAGISTEPRVITAQVLHNTLPAATSDLINDSGYITAADVPTKTSDLTNDSGFITSSAVPTKTSELTNDSGFITSAAVPTAVSELTNDSGYITDAAIETFRKGNPYLQWGVGSNSSGASTPRAELRRMGSGSNYQLGLCYVNAGGTNTLYPLILADGSRNFALLADFTPTVLYNSGGVLIRKTGKLIECVFNNVSTLPTKATIDSAAGGESWLPSGTTTRYFSLWEYKSKAIGFLTVNSSGFTAFRSISASAITSFNLYGTMTWFTS